MRGMRNSYTVCQKPQEQRPTLRKTRYRWEDNIKIDLIETGHGDVYWIYMAESRIQ
jgi:hypothetical protein